MLNLCTTAKLCVPRHHLSAMLVKPFLNTEEAANLFARLYGMPNPTTVKSLDGYDSQNFLVELQNGPNVSKYVLKVMSSEESTNQDGIRAVHSVQRYLKQHGFMCATPIQNIYGEDMKLEAFSQETSKESQYLGKRVYGLLMVRAYPFIPGTPLCDVIPANATQLFYELGKTLARLHKILETYPDDIGPLKMTAKTRTWNMNNVNLLLKYMDVVKDKKNRQLAIAVVETFENKVLARRQEVFCIAILPTQT